MLALLRCACAQNLDADTRQRLLDVFGEPPYKSDELDALMTGNGTDCICLPYFRCKVGNESFYGNGDLESRQMSCANKFDWCCERNRVRKEKRSPREGCGWSGARDVARGESDVNETAAFAEFPWIVAILLTSAGDTWTAKDYLGGGSIIHPSVVLTAAHKVDGRNLTQLKCRAGEWDSRSTTEPYRHQDRRIAKITQHEGYARRFVTNSVALLFLKTPFELTRHVGVACVARAPPPAGARCAGAGWGRRRHGPGEAYATVLKKVEVPIVGVAACEEALRRTRMGVSFSLHASHTCAGARGADTCSGDGGAPLACPVHSSGQRYAIFGMAAWGVGCGSDVPAVYVNVPTFYTWLGDVVEAYGLEATSYQYEESRKL